MPDMRPLASCLVLSLLAAVIAAEPSRAQGAGPSACVSATGPDVSPVTRDSAGNPGSSLLRAGSPARTRIDSASAATNPTVRLLASVSAEEVRFARQPKICVTLRGDARLDSVHVVARRNIQSPVAVGTTYRNVYVAVEILGHLNAQCISARITGQQPNGTCASLDVRDSTSNGRSTPREGTP
jgi:hypothetical protein